MLAEAQGPDDIWQIGLATGTSPLTFQMASNQPLKGLSGGGMFGGPYVEKIGGTYHLWFHRAPSGNLPTDIWHAISTDLLHWTTDPAPVLKHEGKGWICDQVADPYLLHTPTETLLFFDGDNNFPPIRSSIGVIAIP